MLANPLVPVTACDTIIEETGRCCQQSPKSPGQPKDQDRSIRTHGARCFVGGIGQGDITNYSLMEFAVRPSGAPCGLLSLLPQLIRISLVSLLTVANTDRTNLFTTQGQSPPLSRGGGK